MTVRAAGRPDQAGAGRRRRLLRPHLLPRPGDHAGAGAGRLRRRRAPGGRQPGAGPGRRRAADHRRPGLHGPVRARRRRRRRSRPATRSCCGARATAASRRRSSGPTPSTPSTTSWSPGSAAASPAATSARRGRSDGPRPRSRAGSRHALAARHTAGRRRRRRRPGRRRHRRRASRSAASPRAACGPAELGPAASSRRADAPSCGRTTRSAPRRAPADRTALVQADDGVLLRGRGDRPAGRAADRRLRARLHAVDGVLGLPAAHAGRRAGHRQRPPPRRAAGLLRPARARRLRPGRGRALDHRAARRATWPRCSRRGCRAGPVVLVGHSMGGMTIMGLAALRPELFGTEGGRRRADLHLERQPGRPDLRPARAAHPGPGGVLPGRRVDDAAGVPRSPSAPGAWPATSSRRSPARCRSPRPTSTRRWPTTWTR